MPFITYTPECCGFKFIEGMSISANKLKIWLKTEFTEVLFNDQLFEPYEGGKCYQLIMNYPQWSYSKHKVLKEFGFKPVNFWKNNGGRTCAAYQYVPPQAQRTINHMF